MKRDTLVEVLVFVGLLVAGAGARIVLHDLPNFAPVAAISLFAGYYFRSWCLAALVAPAIMAISDLKLGGYEWQMMLLVYAMLTLPVAARPLVRRFLAIERGQIAISAARLAGLVGCSLFASVLFFLSTNFAWWPWTDMYSHDMAGLIECYAAGVPFFRYTLAGDLFFAALLFGGYATAVQLGISPSRSVAHSAAQASVA